MGRRGRSVQVVLFSSPLGKQCFPGEGAPLWFEEYNYCDHEKEKPAEERGPKRLQKLRKQSNRQGLEMEKKQWQLADTGWRRGMCLRPKRGKMLKANSGGLAGKGLVPVFRH